MNKTRSRRVTRKKVIPRHFQKSQASLSQILTTASYKRRVKELQKNNKILAVALQDARLNLANSNKLLQMCSNDDAKILYAKTKLKDMVVCIQTLVSGLNEVMCCLDLKPLALFNSSSEEVRLRIRQPDLDPIEESSSLIEDSNINVSVSGRDSLGPIIPEHGLVSERTTVSGTDHSRKEIFGVQTVGPLDNAQIGLDSVVEDQGTTGRPSNSVPHVPPDSPLTPELDISHSADYFQQLMDLNLIGQSPKKDIIPKNQANHESPRKGSKGMSRIPMRKKNPLPIQSIEFSPPAPTINRKTFVVKDVPTSSCMEETFITQNSARDVMNHRDRRGTYLLAAVPETTATDTLSPIVPSSGVEVPEATIYFNEDMELTGVIPIHNMPLTKRNAVQTSNATTLSSNNLQFNDSVAKSIANIVTVEPEYPLAISTPEPSKRTSDTHDLDESIFSTKKTTKNTSPKFKCPDFNEDMELTGVLPIHNLQPTKFGILTAEPEHSVATSKPGSSKLTCNLDSLNESVLFGKEVGTASNDNSSKSGDSKVVKGSLKRKSIISNKKVPSKTKGRKVPDPQAKETSGRKRRSSVNLKEITSPKSPKMSRKVCSRAISPKKISSSKNVCRRSSREKCNISSNTLYFSSDSDSDIESLSREKKSVHSKISHSPKSNMPTNLIETPSHSYINSISEDSESASYCNFKDDMKSVGRCNLNSPKKTSNRRKPYTFKNSTVHFDQSNSSKRGNVQTTAVEATSDVTPECSTLPQNLNTSKSYLKGNDFSETSHNALEKEMPGLSENLSQLQKSSKALNKDVDKSSKRRKPNQKSLKFSGSETDTDGEIVQTDSKSSKRISTVSFTKDNSRAAKIESDSALDVISPTIQTRARSSQIVGSPGIEKNTVNSATSTCRKSVQFAVDDCYSAFQSIKSKELTSEHKGNLNASKEIGKIKSSKQHSSSRLSTVSKPGILKKRPTSQQILSDEIACGFNNSSSIYNIEKQNENLLKHSQTRANNKLDELLSGLDSTFHNDSGCSSKGKTFDPDSALQSTEVDVVKRPFSGVSERRSKKRATDSSDIFIEIENMCLPARTVSDGVEDTEMYDPRDIKANALESGSKQSDSRQRKHKPQKLKGEEKNLKSQNVKHNMQAQDALVCNEMAKSVNQTDKIIPYETDDLITLKHDKRKNKKYIKNAEVDILTHIKTTPMKTIQLPSTEACTLNEIDTEGVNTLGKQKPEKIKNSSAKKETKSKSKDPVSSRVCKLTQVKKENEISNTPNIQPVVVLEALPACLTMEGDSSAYSKDSNSLGSERPRRNRSAKCLKEPSLNSKMRR